MTEPLPSPVHAPSSSYLNGKGKGRATVDEDDQLEHVLSGRSGHGLSGLDAESKRESLIDQSLACRYLAAQCLVRNSRSLPSMSSELIIRSIKRDMMKR